MPMRNSMRNFKQSSLTPCAQGGRMEFAIAFPHCVDVVTTL